MQRHFVLFLPVSLCVAILVAACGAPPVLQGKNAATPAGVDLGGTWLLRETAGTRGERPGSAEPLIPIGAQQRNRTRRSRGGSDVSVQVFLENGKLLKVSQTAFGIFISYDRAIVEEYTFGENRTVNIGPIEAQRVSGWDGGAFVVETMDRTGTTLYETWFVQDDGATLVRDIRISRDEETSYEQRQYFDRDQ